MTLSKLALAAAIAAAGSAMAFAPQVKAAGPASGSITITGSVVDTTCEVAFSGAGSATNNNLTIGLDQVYASTFTAAGDTTGLKKFQMDLTSCPTNPSGLTVGANFSGGNISTADGTLTNNAGANGSNIAVQLTDDSGNGLDLNTPNPVTDTIDATGAATLKYGAQYYATSVPVTGGAVNTQVTYTLTYQ